MKLLHRIAAMIVAFNLTATPVLAEARNAAEKHRALSMIDDLERAHADIASGKERGVRLKQVAREFIQGCADPASCQEGVRQALVERGYTAESVANFGKVVAEGRRLAESTSMTEQQKEAAFRQIQARNPVKLPSGEGAYVDPALFVLGGFAAIVVGIVVGIWALANSHPVAGGSILAGTAAWAVFWGYVVNGS